MMVSPMQKISFRVRGLLKDRSGLAAIKFAMVFPMMVAMCYGVIEFSSAISVDRKATQVARIAFRPDVSEHERGRHRSKKFRGDGKGDHDTLSAGAVEILGHGRYTSIR